jgi:hypothetical protein
MKKIYRQGDVLIEEIDSIDAGLEMKPAGERVILAEGEATGHHHSVQTTDSDLFGEDVNGVKFLNLCKDSVLTHQEHGPINLGAGTYRVTRQREYSPEEIRNVAD